MTTKQIVYRWMQNHASEHIDNCGEVNTTYLAEAACQEFDAFGPAPTYDAPEEYFDWAVEVEAWYFCYAPIERDGR